jgi:hypothetical protein
MKTKPTRGKGGRKKFSAQKLLSPDNTFEENFSIATIGEFAETQAKREIFQIVALWKVRYAPLFKVHPNESRGAALIHRKQREHVIARLLNILNPALENSNSKPFEDFVKAIGFAKWLNDRGKPVLPQICEALCLIEEMGLKTGTTEKQSGSPKEFTAALEARLDDALDDKQLVRIKKALGLHWPSGRPPKG